MAIDRPNGETLAAGVVGVGSMGRNHARIYAELQSVDLVGVADVDAERARSVADEHATAALPREELLDAADVVSVVVPTQYHYDVVSECLDAGVDVLVEKPFVQDPERGRELIRRARDADAVLQVGHVERFNPAAQTMLDLRQDLDIEAVTARRLGPPLDRDIDDSVVSDLMIHDLDIVTTLLDDVSSVAVASASDGQYATATLRFESGVVARLTASRVTQQRVRELDVTAADRHVTVDYLTQDVEIHRQSFPQFVTDDHDLRYRHEGVIERPLVESTEPLKAELASFVEAVWTDSEPAVTPEDGLRAVELVHTIDELARESEAEGSVASTNDITTQTTR
jgi:predicted dehydrogenase